MTQKKACSINLAPSVIWRSRLVKSRDCISRLHKRLAFLR